MMTAAPRKAGSTRGLKRFWVVVAAMVAVSACGQSQRRTPIAAYQNWDDKFKAATGGLFGWPCTNKVVHDGQTIYEQIDVDQCYKFEAPKRFRGLWYNEFEGSIFCAAPARSCDSETGREMGNRTWLTPTQHLNLDEDGPNGDVYEVDFVGRQSMVRGSYGHGGVFDKEILMDRVISIEKVTDDPRAAEVLTAHPGLTTECAAKVGTNALDVASADVENCFVHTPPQRWVGLLNLGWEWSNFCPEPAKSCGFGGGRGSIWTEFGEGSYTGPELKDGVYAIEFVGRRTVHPGHFGHMSQYEYQMTVDRVISVRKLPDGGKK